MKPNHLVAKCWPSAALVVAFSLATGCTSSFLGGNSVETADVVAMAEAERPEEGLLLVGDATIPMGREVQKVESVSLVTSLDGTGSNPQPSLQRDALVDQMKLHEVRNIEAYLASPNTSLVEVAAFIPPGAQEGDLIDVFVRVDRHSQTTSLEGGWLLRARLQELAIMGGEIHEGHVVGVAEGSILVDSLVDDGSEMLQTRGRVLSGGMVTQSRPLGLRLRTGRSSIRNSAMIGAAINNRFQVIHAGAQQGVATPKTDQYIELLVPPKYKQNLDRYFRVVQSIAIVEQPLERTARIDRLRRELLDPETVARAALHLEAIGTEGVQPLEEALASTDPLVRFYAAEALAYLDVTEAAPVLAEAARSEPAFRWHALTALSAMRDLAAREALISLLDETSAETRYGAFRALSARDSHDALVGGRVLGEAYYYHRVPSEAPAMVHVSRRRRPEIVVFGEDIPLETPLVLLVGDDVTIKSCGENRLRVSRIASNPADDEQYECDATLGELLQALGRLKLSYPETLQLLQQARQKNYFTARLVFDALPQPGRSYTAGESTGAISAEEAPETPLPALFQYDPEETGEVPAEEEAAEFDFNEEDPQDEGEGSDPPQSRGVLGRILGSSGS